MRLILGILTFLHLNVAFSWLIYIKCPQNLTELHSNDNLKYLTYKNFLGSVSDFVSKAAFAKINSVIKYDN